MTGIITSLPPSIEPPPSSTTGNPQVLGPLAYVPAIPTLAQTWTGIQTFTPGTVVLQGTGGASQVLKQLTPNGPVTVGQLSFSDISGTIGPVQIPPPTVSTLGGVFSKAATSHQFLIQIGTDGSVTSAQPAFSDISGTISATQLPNPSASTLGGVQSAAAVSHQWINSISTGGVPSLTQPAIADISGWGTGVAAALGTNIGSAGAPLLFNGVGGTPSSLTLTNASGLPLTGLANQGAWTFLFNNTSGSAAPTANTIDGLTLKASPASTDEVIIWDVAGSAIKKATISGIGTSSGVSSIAGNTGAFTLTGGITNSTNAIQLSLTNATFQSSTLSPTGTTSASGVMMGLGSTCKLTPVYSGRIKVEFQCDVANSGASSANFVSFRWGTGAAPANAAAFTGTQVGSTLNAQIQTSAVIVPLSLTGIITGLTPGTAYWFDLGVSTSAGTCTVSNVSCNAFEF